MSSSSISKEANAVADTFSAAIAEKSGALEKEPIRARTAYLPD